MCPRSVSRNRLGQRSFFGSLEGVSEELKDGSKYWTYEYVTQVRIPGTHQLLIIPTITKVFVYFEDVILHTPRVILKYWKQQTVDQSSLGQLSSFFSFPGLTHNERQGFWNLPSRICCHDLKARFRWFAIFVHAERSVPWYHLGWFVTAIWSFSQIFPITANHKRLCASWYNTILALLTQRDVQAGLYFAFLRSNR